MRRFAKAAFLRTAAASLQVVDGVSVPPSTVSDVLLQDLSWSTLASLFTARDGSTLIHQPAGEKDDGKFALSSNLRACALLPVTRVVAQQRVTHWAPFLIDTGAGETYFGTKTVDKLGLDCADKVEVFGQRIVLRDATSHFDDINLLGTDVLSCGDLSVSYPGGRVCFQRTVHRPRAFYWVQQRSSDGERIGPTFQVTPTSCTVDGLKDVIESWMDAPLKESACLTIYEPKSNVPVANTAGTLETNAEWAPYGFVVHHA